MTTKKSVPGKRPRKSPRAVLAHKKVALLSPPDPVDPKIEVDQLRAFQANRLAAAELVREKSRATEAEMLAEQERLVEERRVRKYAQIREERETRPLPNLEKYSRSASVPLTRWEKFKQWVKNDLEDR